MQLYSIVLRWRISTKVYSRPAVSYDFEIYCALKFCSINKTIAAAVNFIKFVESSSNCFSCKCLQEFLWHPSKGINSTALQIIDLI